MEYVICTAQSFWSDPEAKLLMDKFREYKHDVRLRRAQCENRFKTVRKRKGWVDEQEAKAGTLNVNGDNSLKKKKLLDDNRSTSGISATQPDNSDLLPKSQESTETIEVDVDVRRGVGQVSYSNAACESDHHDDEKRDKKRFRQTLSTVLLQIHREKEEARERRHQEKMELLKMLLQ